MDSGATFSCSHKDVRPMRRRGGEQSPRKGFSLAALDRDAPPGPRPRETPDGVYDTPGGPPPPTDINALVKLSTAHRTLVALYQRHKPGMLSMLPVMLRRVAVDDLLARASEIR
eukprot:gene22-14686_t